MEQHPVPQNVTTFQFRLVGDMTIKQFGYLAGGVILGYVCYKLPLPFFFTWPLGLTALLGGIGLAFVPVAERPMDIWVTSFLKNTYNPTQYVWQKTAAAPEAKETSVAPVKKSFFQSLFPDRKAKPVPAHEPQAQPATHMLPQVQYVPPEPVVSVHSETPRPVAIGHLQPSVSDLVGRFFKPKASPAPEPAQSVSPRAPQPGLYQATQPQKSPSVTGERLSATGTETKLPGETVSPGTNATNDQKIENLEKMIASMQKEMAAKMANEKRFGELKEQLAQALSQKEQSDRELITLRQQLGRVAPGPAPVTRPAGFIKVNPTKGPTVRVIAPEGAVRAGLPRLTTYPNVVSGIVKDQNGNLLPGVLVTVRDKDDIPLRALKTNKLGQFAASTPLPNGTYLIEVEDPRTAFTFDRAQATLIGAVLPPIEIAAKSQKQINRDKLAKELFGDQGVK